MGPIGKTLLSNNHYSLCNNPEEGSSNDRDHLQNEHTVKYPNLPLAMSPVPHSEELPVPNPPLNLNSSHDNSDSDEDHGQQEGLEFYNDIWSVIEAPGHQHNPTKWNLFIDSSKVSLKAVLLCT